MRKPSGVVGTAGAIGATLGVGCGGTAQLPEPPPSQADAAASTDALDELFRDGTAEDIAQELEAMVNESGADGGPVPLYKGLSV